MKKTITLDHITKIEGHAALHVVLKGDQVETCELSSVEGARYFEEILLGRDYTEAFEISSRICGICSCAHTVAAIMAIENGLGLSPSTQTCKLRELLTLGERIRSHSTHLYFMALPDYLGYESAMAMLPKYKPEVGRALRLMKLGNTIIRKIGGRDMHPVSAAVGGFVGFPNNKDIQKCLEQLKAAKKDADETAKLFMKVKSPDFERQINCYSLCFPGEYGLLRGDVTASGHSFQQSQYEHYISEFHERHSTAKFVNQGGEEFRVGALSRLNNNHEHLSPDAQKMLQKSKLKLPCFNPFYNNLAQAIELIHCLDHAINILTDFDIRPEEIRTAKLKECRGVAAIEVPRGILWHEYELDKKGKITKANIITPTTQNLHAIQEDIRAYLPSIMDLKREQVELEIEKLIRSYDPCFSCSTHFLEVDWEQVAA